MDTSGTPKSFVLKTRNSESLDPLLKDIQTLMLPNTASSLKQTKSNTMKDFTQVAGQYGITHFLILSQTKIGTNLRIARTPRGPTLSFSVTSYALIKDVQSIQRRPNAHSEKVFNESPLVVLNNMSGDAKHLKLMALMFQNLFPSIKVQTMQLSNAKRIILFNYTGAEDDENGGSVEIRHYSISIKNRVGLSRSIKTVLKNTAPALQSYEDISEFVLNNTQGYNSETDIEEATLDNTVQVSSMNISEHQRAVKLSEIGPRLELKLMKIQEGFCEGNVIYHAYMKKTKDEVRETGIKIKKRSDDKLKRKQEQAANVDKKKKKKRTNVKDKGELTEMLEEADEEEVSEDENFA